jgi:Protein of unknown function (DUF1559)
MARCRAGKHPRSGLTVAELAVLVVMLTIVVGLLLTAIPHMRASAQRAQCANNLREMGMASRAFRDARGFLPAARIAEGYATWAVQIAPYLHISKDNKLLLWDLSKTYYLQGDEVRTAQVALFFCPARRRPPQMSNSGDGPLSGKPDTRDYPGALGDYAGCSGDGDPDRPWQTADADGAIILGDVLKRSGDSILDWRGRVDLGALTTGQARTILLGEKHVPWGHFGERRFGDGSLYNGDYPASSSRIGGPGYGLAASPEAPFHEQFGSYHPGICQFLMADVSVQALTNSISEDVLGRLTRRGP